MENFILNTHYKGRFYGHETFPLRQLWLTKAYNAVSDYTDLCPKSIFKDKESIVRFGVGMNMVKSIQHWSLACDIIEPKGNVFKTTQLGDFLFGTNGLDRYGEYDSTPWLMHWVLAGRGSNRAARSTTWAWLFNYVTQSSFEKKHINDGLIQYVSDRGKSVSLNTIQTDVDVCFRSYAPRDAKSSPEDTSEPILGELGLLTADTKSSFRFRRGVKNTLPTGLFGFALLEFWDEHSPGINTLSFDSITHDFGSPGRVFKLDENSISDYIIDLETMTNENIVWSDSAGVRQVIRREGCPNKYTLLEKAYG